MTQTYHVSLLASVLSGLLLAAQAEAKIIGGANCTVSDGKGRVAFGDKPQAKLYSTGQELLFDFFDVKFGAGQPVTYNAGNWVDNYDDHTVYANLKFTILVPEEAQEDKTFVAQGQWDDLGHLPGDWETSRKSATILLNCQMEP